jgi:uncharacterized membrane protein YcgQ (UPF0703/DUF1980 family)
METSVVDTCTNSANKSSRSANATSMVSESVICAERKKNTHTQIQPNLIQPTTTTEKKSPEREREVAVFGKSLEFSGNGKVTVGKLLSILPLVYRFFHAQSLESLIAATHCLFFRFFQILSKAGTLSKPDLLSAHAPS